MRKKRKEKRKKEMPIEFFYIFTFPKNLKQMKNINEKEKGKRIFLQTYNEKSEWRETVYFLFIEMEI